MMFCYSLVVCKYPLKKGLHQQFKEILASTMKELNFRPSAFVVFF